MVSMQPSNICGAQTTVGSGTCGFNSYCLTDGTKDQTTCKCLEQYSFFDEERKYKGCKPDFQPQSCDLDEEASMMQFQFRTMHQVNWPLSDYEKYNPITEDQCRQLCLIDCFCAVVVYNDQGRACYKKKLPLSNGNMAGDVHATVLVKVPKNSNAQSYPIESSKWKKDKKYWILGSSLLLVEGDTIALEPLPEQWFKSILVSLPRSMSTAMGSSCWSSSVVGVMLSWRQQRIKKY